MSSPLHQRLEEALKPFLPQAALTYCVDFLIQKKVSLTLTRGRATKLGDYRHPWQGKGHRISVNQTLNKYAFLVTLIHEYAHLLVWEQFANKVKPHGEHWKQTFSELMSPLLNTTVFPETLIPVLQTYFAAPKASSCADPDLMRALADFDSGRDKYQFLEELPEGSRFSTRQGRVFIKGSKRRTRFICTEIATGKQYLFHALSPVALTPLAQTAG